jgi:superfamily I DNA/RNA helicase
LCNCSISAGDVSLSVQCQIKEERRLAYVALTRARVNAFITFAHRRQVRIASLASYIDAHRLIGRLDIGMLIW